MTKLTLSESDTGTVCAGVHEAHHQKPGLLAESLKTVDNCLPALLVLTKNKVVVGS